MRIELEQTAEFLYTDKVFLEPHVLRILPRPGRARQIIEKHLFIEPRPAGVTEITDINNNPEYNVWFCGLTNHLTVRSRILMNIHTDNPFDFLIHPSYGNTLPMAYDERVQNLLAPALVPLPLNTEIEAWVKELLTASNHQTLTFLGKLCQEIQNTFTYEVREKGMPLPPDNTWSRRNGSCRDFAWLAVGICRSLGLAARFVSGYYFGEEGEPAELHAWFETYIPGGGWRGFDPTHGIACFEHHIPLSVSPQPEYTLPVKGTFRGFAQSRMDFRVNLTQLPANAG